MEILKSGSYEIFDSFGQDGSLIFKAATTCYRSEETTKKTKDEMINALIKSGHTAMIEFMWIPIHIIGEDPTPIFTGVIKYINVIPIHPLGGGTEYIAVGNARAWRDWIETFYNTKLSSPAHHYSLYNAIVCELYALNPIIFSDSYSIECSHGYSKVKVYDGSGVMNHPLVKWIMVKFNDVSRGLTHELVRHRVMSFAQASTRYVTASNFNVILPVEDCLSFEQKMIVEDYLKQGDEIYQYLIANNVTKNYARQILPTGICTDICVAGTLADWASVFKLRCATDAHWEIREIMTRLKDETVFRDIIL